MFDQMAMDWDPSPQRSGFTPHRNSQTHAPPASLTARDDTHMTAMRRALQAARYRADMAESMLSRVRSDSVENSAFSSPRASAAFSDPARLPSTGFQGQQQQRVFANAPTPSFEFDPDFRRKQPGAALTETASASRSGEQPAGSSSWGLPNNDPMLTLRKSAYVPPITSQQKIKIVHKSAIRKCAQSCSGPVCSSCPSVLCFF